MMDSYAYNYVCGNAWPENKKIKTIEFVGRLWEYYLVYTNKTCVTDEGDIIRRGRAAGWLEEQDLIGAYLERRTAAAILHRFLLTELEEPDEDSWGEATKLQDLYDCRTCVNHVAQIFAKGIMKEYQQTDKRVFGMREPLWEEECEQILKRVFEPSKRLTGVTKEDAAPVNKNCGSSNMAANAAKTATRVSRDEAVMLQKKAGGLLVDVRTAAAYSQSALEGAVHFSMNDILDYPERVAENKETYIYLYCDKGYQSEIAAMRLVEAGYKNIYYFGLEDK